MRLPMHALMVFDVAASHESFLKAAKDLNVTPGAVSRQIKKLEGAMNMSLFDRKNQKVTLTRDGREVWQSIHDHFVQIKANAEKVISRNAAKQLNVRCSMLFMRYWLLPRLPAFYNLHPEVKIAFQIARYADTTGVEEDCSIRTGSGRYPGFMADFLLDASIVPVCSPGYLDKNPGIKSVADLRHHTLLHSTANPESWRRWLGSRANTILEAAQHIEIDGDGLLYQAAIEGLGVVLSRYCLVTSELASQQLVLPLGPPPPTGEGYYLAYQKQEPFPPGFKAFRQWLIEEASGCRTSFREYLCTSTE